MSMTLIPCNGPICPPDLSVGPTNGSKPLAASTAKVWPLALDFTIMASQGPGNQGRFQGSPHARARSGAGKSNGSFPDSQINCGVRVALQSPHTAPIETNFFGYNHFRGLPRGPDIGPGTRDEACAR